MDKSEYGQIQENALHLFRTGYNCAQSVLLSLLINCDLNTQKGKDKFKKDNLKESVCGKCIKDSIFLSLKILSENTSDNY